jgi:nucleotide-binding universal stress UspA family protein
MSRYCNIVVGVDGSPESLHALQEAFKLADSRSLSAVSVAPPYEGDLRMVGVNQVKSLMREPCDTALAKAQELAAKAHRKIKTACLIGLPHEGVVDFAETENCDLIVMGTKGYGLLERVLLGKVTRRVIGFTKRDVMVVPLQGKVGWEKIMLATDGSENSRPAANRALELAQTFGAELKISSIVEMPSRLSGNAGATLAQILQEREGMLEGLRAEAEGRGIKTECFLSQGFPARTPVAQAQNAGVNLMVMGSHGRTGLTRLLMGSVTERVMGLAPCPVLVVKM